MLQTIRDKFTGWIAIVFIVLISMTLVISFGNMDQTPLQDDVVITVNDEEITLFEFQEEFSNKLVEFQDLLGDDVPEVLEQSIREQLYTLPDETLVLTGHGDRTTIGREKKTNPYVSESVT